MKLVIDNLHKKYDKQIAVDDISFEINQAETIGILGPNGAGKTTLFYMIAGLINPDMGNIYLGDSKINDESISTRTSLGLSYLPQESSIFRGLTVEQNILSSLEQRKGLQAKERNELLNSLLVEFNLSEFSETMGLKLSGGERRRTEIARSLASDPKFILLDEPFAGIDPLAVSDLKNTIKKLKIIRSLLRDHSGRTQGWESVC